MFVLLLDAAADRIAEQGRAEFDSAVEALRAGTIFAHDQRQYSKWHSRSAVRAAHVLSGHALEAAVMRVASMFPGNVQRGTV